MTVNKIGRNADIGLALGSGAARGLAHIGVLKALKDKGIPINLISGSSMGALVGACFAREGDISELEELALRTDWMQLIKLADPNLAFMLKGFIHGHKVKELLKTIIGDVRFEDLRIPLAVVATDINTGDEVVIKEGSVIEAVRASISVPAIFAPVRLLGRFLIDGGIVNPVPVGVVREMGASFVIACNVIHALRDRRSVSVENRAGELSLGVSGWKHNVSFKTLDDKIATLMHENKDKLRDFNTLIDSFKKKFFKSEALLEVDMPNVFDTIINAIYIMEYEIAKSNMREADLAIIPDTRRISSLEFHRSKEAIHCGYHAAMAVLENGAISFWKE